MIMSLGNICLANFIASYYNKCSEKDIDFQPSLLPNYVDCNDNRLVQPHKLIKLQRSGKIPLQRTRKVILRYHKPD